MKLSSNRVLSAAVILLLAVNIILLLFIWKGKEKPEPKRPSGSGAFETMAKELNMTDQQQNDYKKLRDDHFATIRPLFDSIREIRKDFMRLVKEENVSDSALNAYSKKVAEKQAAIDKLTFNHFRKVRALFSGDQQKQYDEYMQKIMTQRMNGSRRRDSANKK